MGILLFVAAWVALSAHTHTALHHDMAEQFVWAHSWQLGYPKHPPLPTWLFMLAQTVLPAKPATLYGLSAVCIGLAGVFTYLAARELMPPTLALCVAGLWGLQQPFGWRAWIYNHNTVLVMAVAMAVYFAVRGARRNEQGSWAAAGLAAGLAMSTKLQAVVPLVGVLWALWRSGSLESLASRKGGPWPSCWAPWCARHRCGGWQQATPMRLNTPRTNWGAARARATPCAWGSSWCPNCACWRWPWWSC
ncbi:ArnT family glycosyltransferase [Aquabacterium sp.]|uniref:ArnT family glycosyltransferase n=1 Tax=Aquabacterium sp. TaxID=1872578 RepID=UPI00403765C2